MTYKAKGGIEVQIFGLKFDKNSILYWILPYIACIMISVMLSSLSYFKALTIISQQAIKAHEESVVAISDKVEPLLSTANTAMMQIISSGKIEEVCERSGNKQKEDYFSFGMLQSELKSAGNLSDLISDEYIYFVKNRLLLTGDNFYTGDEIEAQFKLNFTLNSKDIQDLLNSKEAVNYHLIPSGKGTQAFLIHAIPYQGKYENGAVVILPLDTSLFLESLSIHSQTKGRFAAIVDNNNAVLLSGTWPNKRIFYQNYITTVQSTEYGIGAGRIVASGIASKVSGWEFVTGIPNNVLMEPMSDIIVWIFSFVILGLIVGITVAFYFAKKNYSSINRLVKNFMDSLSLSKRDGFSFIGLEKMLEDLIRERKNMVRTFEKYQNTAREHSLLKLLDGSPYRTSEMLKSLRELNIDMSGNHYVLMIISIDDFSHVFFDEKADEDESIFDLIKLIISNVVGELANKEYPSYLTEFMGYYVCVLNMRRHTDDAQANIKKIAESSIDFIRTNFGIMVSAMISEECLSLDSIHNKFIEAINQFDLIDHQNTVYTVMDIKEVGDRSALQGPIAADFMQQARLDLENEIDKLYRKEPEIYEHLKKAVRKVNTVEAANGTEDGSSSTRWANEICEYIDQNYPDQALNISFLAYRFNMNPAYIGRRFKDVMGIGLLEYIHLKRIEEAVKWIAEGKRLKEVAEKVGFSNTLTMRRVFERYKNEHLLKQRI